MKQRLLFLGPPGAGKGTQAEILCKTEKLLHLSTGDLLRSEVAAASPLGQEAEAVMARGELVSDDLVLSIVEKKLLAKDQDGWLLDGFPRNLSQSKALQELLLKINQPIEAVLLIRLSDEILIKRLLSRGRADDNEAVIRHRLEVYSQQTAPLIDFYRDKGILHIVEGNGDIHQIACRIKDCLG